jgi:hypothetical protein
MKWQSILAGAWASVFGTLFYSGHGFGGCANRQ